MKIALLLIASYLVGSIPFGVIVGRAWRGVDVRKYGSGNIGFANALRVLGPGPAAVVLLGDALKGYLPVTAGRYLLARLALSATEGSLAPATPYTDLWLLAVALMPILGHSFSIFLKLRGGRAVATTAGALLAMCWPAALVAILVWLSVVAATRYISLGSIAAAAAVPIYLALSSVRPQWTLFWTAVGALVILRHLPNIKRLLAGTEAKLGQKTQLP